MERFGPPTQVRIMWKPKPKWEAAGKDTMYGLYCRIAPDGVAQFREIDGGSNEFVIDGNFCSF